MSAKPLMLLVMAAAAALAPLPAQTPTSKPAKGAATSKPRPRWMEPPDDRYVKVLAGKTLEEGKGFPGVIVLGRSSETDSDLIGWGREEPKPHPFWLYFEKGPWKLTLCVNLDSDTHAGMNHAIIIAGEGAPPTKKGLKIGDSLARVKQVYGEPGRFDSALVGLEQLGQEHTWTTFGQNGKGERYVVSDPPEFAHALFFPAHRLLVAVENDHVTSMAVVAAEEPLPIFLRPDDRVPKNRSVAIDPSVKVPQAVPEDGQNARKDGVQFLVPPIPELTRFESAAFSAMVPKTWQRDDRNRWAAPDGDSSVTVSISQAAPDETPEVILESAASTLSLTEMLPSFRRHLPADLCKAAGATDGACSLLRKAGKPGGTDSLVYHMVLAKGPARLHAIVTRPIHPTFEELPDGRTRASAFMGSPDGDALARAVMRSLRIKG